ncbi:MAG: RNA methyltransferase [Caldilineaceae bacterium]|nr:RNA methyltransferase [Caldilineaceae bacterium]
MLYASRPLPLADVVGFCFTQRRTPIPVTGGNGREEFLMRITSLQNARIKEVVKLHEHKQRRRQAKFLIEGYRTLHYAVAQAYPLAELYICPALFLGNNEGKLIQQIAATGVPVFEVTVELFQKLSFRPRREGLLAVAPQRQHALANHLVGHHDFYVVAEAIEKPGNLGTILRSADGAGATGVIVCDPYTDVWHPEVLYGSVGAFFTVPIFTCTTSEAITWCRRWNVQMLAATPHADQLYTTVDMHKALALVVGTEQYGLSPAWLAAADEQIGLPMLGTANSLNVAMAATVLMYEVVRQRMGKG